MIKRLRERLTSRRVPRLEGDGPIVSFLVIVYDMPAQAEKTLRSLMTDYQVGVNARDYEVIIVENESPNLMRSGFIQSLPANFSYHCRMETEPTPVHAINFAASLARGQHICLMIDGARMLTPGVIRNILRGHRLCERSVVTVPGYHLGYEVQQEAVNSGYGVEEERRLLKSIDWPSDGYRLFDVACFSGSAIPGFFLPNSESNCISMPASLWHELGGCDTKFNLQGGGLVNLDLYRRACESPGVTHVITPGEGTFHQFHGGVTTGGKNTEVRAALIEACEKQYLELRGYPFASPETDPVYIGEMPVQVQRFLRESSRRVSEARQDDGTVKHLKLLK